VEAAGMMPEHEIHHRGQLYTMLAMPNVPRRRSRHDGMRTFRLDGRRLNLHLNSEIIRR
jgi:hypothetical protein